MKKFGIMIAAFALAGGLFAQALPFSNFNVEKGEEIKVTEDAFFLNIGPKIKVDGKEETLPAEIGKDCLVLGFSRTYYYQGKEINKSYEMIFSDITVDKELKKAKPLDEVPYGTVIGKSKSGKSKVYIRADGFDPNLLSCILNTPVCVNNYWYFSAEILMPTTPKILEFQPITSKKTEIMFGDGPDTLAGLAAGSKPDDEGSFAQFPVKSVMIKTKLKEYPTQTKKTNKTEMLLEMRVFNNCPTSTKVDAFGTKIVMHFQKGFDDYLKNEYKIGQEIYIYCYLFYTYKGELHAMVRDYTLVSPDSIVQENLQKVQKAILDSQETKNE